MTATITTPPCCDLCVIGAGAAGLSVAAGAAQLGARVSLIERDRMGGDCLNTGCVPSKALIAAAAQTRAPERAAPFGVTLEPARVDWAAVQAHLRETIAALAPHDSVARFEGLGVTVHQGDARFVDPRTLEVTGANGHSRRLRPRRVVIATGARPVWPALPGLPESPDPERGLLTHETLFDLPRLPAHLLILGAGPIGCEMAQAFRRLGAAVTLMDQDRILSRDDPALVAPLRAALIADGVRLHEQTRALAVTLAPGGGVTLTLGPAVPPLAAASPPALFPPAPSPPAQVTGDALLVALGRRPDLDALDLDSAGIAATPGGVTVDRRLRTTNRRVFALGDAADLGPGARLTHAASLQAGVVLQNALLRWPARLDLAALPHVTFTDPELAQVGLTEAEARATLGRVRVLTWSLAATDRARTDRLTDRPAPGPGLVSVVLGPRGRLVGAGVVGPHAGELIQPWVLALQAGLPLRRMASLIAPYPTLGEASKRAAGTAFTEALFGPRMRRLVRLLARLG